LTKLIPDLVEALGGEGRGVGEAPAGAAQRGGAVTGPAQAPMDTDPDSAPF
jgi:recombination associated protein RdgC